MLVQCFVGQWIVSEGPGESDVRMVRDGAYREFSSSFSGILTLLQIGCVGVMLCESVNCE